MEKRPNPPQGIPPLPYPGSPGDNIGFIETQPDLHPVQQPIYEYVTDEPQIIQPVQQPVHQHIQQPVHQHIPQQPQFLHPVQQPVHQHIQQQPVHQHIQQQPVHQHIQQQPQVSTPANPVLVVTQMPADAPGQMVCPHCQTAVVTKTEYKVGVYNWIWCFLLGIIGCWPCFVIPFFLKGCKDVKHSCPTCNNVLHIHRRR